MTIASSRFVSSMSVRATEGPARNRWYAQVPIGDPEDDEGGIGYDDDEDEDDDDEEWDDGDDDG